MQRSNYNFILYQQHYGQEEGILGYIFLYMYTYRLLSKKTMTVVWPTPRSSKRKLTSSFSTKPMPFRLLTTRWTRFYGWPEPFALVRLSTQSHLLLIWQVSTGIYGSYSRRTIALEREISPTTTSTRKTACSALHYREYLVWNPWCWTTTGDVIATGTTP